MDDFHSQSWTIFTHQVGRFSLTKLAIIHLLAGEELTGAEGVLVGVVGVDPGDVEGGVGVSAPAAAAVYRVVDAAEAVLTGQAEHHTVVLAVGDAPTERRVAAWKARGAPRPLMRRALLWPLESVHSRWSMTPGGIGRRSKSVII